MCYFGFFVFFLLFAFFDDDADVARGGGGCLFICIDIIAIIASVSDADSVYYLFY